MLRRCRLSRLSGPEALGYDPQEIARRRFRKKLPPVPADVRRPSNLWDASSTSGAADGAHGTAGASMMGAVPFPTPDGAAVPAEVSGRGNRGGDPSNAPSAKMTAAERIQAARDARPKRTAVRRYSGIQQEVLHLYKDLMIAASKKTDPESRRCLEDYIRQEFRQHLDLPRKNVTQIEWYIHSGRNRLEALQASKPADKFSIAGPGRSR